MCFIRRGGRRAWEVGIREGERLTGVREIRFDTNFRGSGGMAGIK
jgi:hypothetical protein